MAKRILIETSILALFCVSCLPGEAQDTAGKKKVAFGPTGLAAPQVVRSGTVPVGRAIGSVLPSTVRKSYPASHLERGLLFKQQGKVDDALLEFILSVQENPAQVRALYEQAEIFKQKGKSILARSALEQALAISPGYTDARTSLLQLHVQSGNLFGAASEMGRMLGLNNEARTGSKPVSSSSSSSSSSVPVSQNAGAKTARPGVPSSNGIERKPAAAKADSMVSRIVSTPTAELRAEQPAQETQDPAQAIASWLAPEQTKKGQEDQVESKPAPTAVSREALPGATPSFDAVAASLGLLPQQKDSTPTATTPEVKPGGTTTIASAQSSVGTTTGSVNGAVVAGLMANHPGAHPGNSAGDKGGLFGRTMTALRHPPVPRVPHLFGARNDSGTVQSTQAPSMVPRRSRLGMPGMPVAGWMKTLSNPLRSSGAKPQKNAAPNPSSLLSSNAASPSSVTITRIATPAENVANQRDQPSSPDALSPQMQKMLDRIMPPPAAPEPLASPSQPDVAPTQSPVPTAASLTPGSTLPDAVSKAIAAAAPAGVADSTKTPIAGVPLDNRPRPPYGLLQSNAATRMPELMGETVISRNATMAAQPPQESWMGNVMKKASAMMPKMPNLPKMPEMPHFSMPAFLGGHKEERTPQALASAVTPVPPDSVASPPTAAPTDLRVIPSDVRSILSKVEGSRAIDSTPNAAEGSVPPSKAAVATTAPVAPGAPSVVPVAPLPQPGLMDGLPDVVKNILGGFTTPAPVSQQEPPLQPAVNEPQTAAVEAAPPVVAGVTPQTVAPAPQPGLMEGLPDVVKNILGGFAAPTPAQKVAPQPAETETSGVPSDAAPIVVAIVPPAATSAATAAAESPPTAAAPALPPAVQSALNAAVNPAKGADTASSSAAPSYAPPKAPGPTPVDMQGILSKLSLAIPQQAASFFHLKRNGASARGPVTPGGINVSSGMIQPVPGSAVKHAPVPPSARQTHSRAEVIAIPAQPVGLPRKDVPTALPSVVNDILNKVDARFVPTVVATTVPGQYVPTPVQLEKGTGEGPQPIASAAVGAALPVPVPALPTGSNNMFENVPVPEMRPKAPTPVPVNVQAILGKIPTANPASAKLNLKLGAAALLPQPTAVKLQNGQPVIAAAPSAQVDVHSPDVQALHPNQQPLNVLPGQVSAVQATPSLPVLVRDVLGVAEKLLPSVSAPAAATRAFVLEPLAIAREDVQGPSPIASSAAPFSPAAAPTPIGADLSQHFSGVVPEVRPQTQPAVAPVAEAAPPMVAQVAPAAVFPTAQAAATQQTLPAPTATKAQQPYSGPKLTNAQRTRSGAFTYMHPVLDTDRLFGTGQMRTIPASAAKTEKPKAPPPPPEDAITKRMRYLLAHGTQNLKPGEAFMYSEETGEGILFMPGGGSERRKLTSPQDHDQVLQQRRPDIVEPKDLQYSLSLLGKLLPPQQEQRRAREQPIESGPTLEQLMDQTGKGFFGWVKGTFKFGGK